MRILYPPEVSPITKAEFLRDGLASLFIHGIAVLIFLAMPAVTPYEARKATVDLHKAVSIVAPNLKEFTQKEPNVGKVSHSIDSSSALKPASVRSRAFRPPTLPGDPKLQSETIAPPPQLQPSVVGPALAGIPPAAVPAIPTKPKNPFEDVGGPTPANIPDHPVIQAPKSGLPELGRGASQPSAIPSPISRTPEAGGSQMQLLSDPQGLDFKPYFLAVAADVNPHWLGLVPRDERRQGSVVVQFSIRRDGRAYNPTITRASPIPLFNLWAVGAIRDSYFPAFPQGYKGDEIRLQMTFLYNISGR